MAGRHIYTWLFVVFFLFFPSSLAKLLVLVFRGSTRLSVSFKSWGLVIQIMDIFKVLVQVCINNLLLTRVYNFHSACSSLRAQDCVVCILIFPGRDV